ncbi:hypothetical protein FQA39_LY03352 [Lamprigera yunnana]|nr:hypothetical protein FQA39_LY03352 [Lamprigera yunnana]
MASWNIVESYLEIDKLQYELKKIGFVTTCNIQSMRQILALEKLDKTIVYPKCTVVFDDEVNVCEEKLNVLKDKISIFTCDSSRRELLVLDSRLSHLMCRVNNIPITNVDRKRRRATLVSYVLEVSKQLKLKSGKPLGHNATVSFFISDDSEKGEICGPKTDLLDLIKILIPSGNTTLCAAIIAIFPQLATSLTLLNNFNFDSVCFASV